MLKEDRNCEHRIDLVDFQRRHSRENRAIDNPRNKYGHVLHAWVNLPRVPRELQVESCTKPVESIKSDICIRATSLSVIRHRTGLRRTFRYQLDLVLSRPWPAGVASVRTTGVRIEAPIQLT